VGLSDDLDARPHPRQSIDALLETLERTDRDALLRALTDRKGRWYRWSSADLAARLAEDDLDITYDQIRVWRWRNAG
jgi:hypothetical protein